MKNALSISVQTGRTAACGTGSFIHPPSLLRRGFSLLELAAIFVIAGVIGGAFLLMGAEWVKSEERHTLDQQLMTLQMALERFQFHNNRLPCPADWSLPRTHASHGVEVTEPGGCKQSGSPSVGGTPGASGQVAYGAVPYKTLGLTELQMYDVVGNVVHYYVDERMTVRDATLIYPPNNDEIGNIKIMDSAGSTRTEKAVYALLSHGMNRRGAIDRNGDEINPVTTDPLEQENNHRDETGNPTPFNNVLIQGLDEAEYDDRVYFRTRLMLGEEIARGEYCNARTLEWGQNDATCSSSVGRLMNGESVEVRDVTLPDTGHITASCRGDKIQTNNGFCSLSSEDDCEDQLVIWGPGGECAAQSGVVGDGSTKTLNDYTDPATGTANVSCSAGYLTVVDSSCDVHASCPAQPVSWKVNGDVCNGNLTDTLLHGSSKGLADSSGPATGNVTVTCNSGTLSLSGKTCNTSPDCEPTNIPWEVDGNICAADIPALADGESAVIDDTDTLNSGSATATCSSGSVSLSNTECLAYCEAQPVMWSAGNYNCSASTGAMQHTETKTLSDLLNSGSVDLECKNSDLIQTNEVCYGPEAEPCLKTVDKNITRFFTFGSMHTCGLNPSGEAYCWGANDTGQLGHGGSEAKLYPEKVAMPAGVNYFTELDPGSWHTCAIGDDGNAYCWGWALDGQLGNGDISDQYAPVKVVNPPGTNGFIQISAGTWHTCGIADDNQAYCWGNGDRGQLGDGTEASYLVPMPVTNPAGVTGFTQISSARQHTCGMGDDGNAYCWGEGDYGRLGNGSYSDETLPALVPPPAGVLFTSVKSGYYHSCATANDNNIYCWGWGGWGAVGIVTDTVVYDPTQVTNPPGVTLTTLSTGWYHNCSIGSDSQAYCWGDGAYDQLGNGSTDDKFTPYPVTLPDGVSGFAEVTAGWWHSCAVTPDEEAYCWGYNDGRIGNGALADEPLPVQVIDSQIVSCDLEFCVPPIGQISSGTAHSCGIGEDGKVYCWGSGANGRLGNGGLADQTYPTRVTVPVGLDNFTVVSSGDKHSCAVGNNGNAYCWGSGANGRLGNGGTTDEASPVVVQKPLGVSSYIDIAAGDEHSCAIGNDGNAYCWGTGTNGRLGNGGTVQQTTPVKVTMPAGVSAFTVIDVGATHSCAIGDDKNMFCWGAGLNGRLGDGSASDFALPVQVVRPSGVSGWSALSLGESHSCGITSDGNGHTYCWGNGANGRLGMGDTNDQLQPKQVQYPTGVTGYTTVSAGTTHSCATGRDDNGYCWGQATYGRLGNNNAVTQQLTAVQVTNPGGMEGFSAVFAGEEHSCGMGRDGTAYCWGRGLNGRLGNGGTADQHIPVPLEQAPDDGIIPLVSVSEGVAHSCGLDSDGNAYCWGLGGLGRLGYGGERSKSTPTPVAKPAGVTSFLSVSAGDGHSCGLGNDGNAYCWGAGARGRLGYGGEEDQMTPVMVQKPVGVTSYTFVSASYWGSCALADTGDAYCWGHGVNGSLGYGGTEDQLTPVLVTKPVGVTSWTSLTQGIDHACALANDNNAYCWGRSYSGGLGDGTGLQQESPVKVQAPLLVTFTSITAGNDFTCAIGNDNQTYCWGDAGKGQLGNGDTTDQLTPVAVTEPVGVNFTEIKSWGQHTCGIGTDGNAWCWGAGGNGRLGNADTVDKLTPVQVITPPGLTLLSARAGWAHSCGLGDDGNAYCWGTGQNGRLGNDDTVDKHTPTRVVDTYYLQPPYCISEICTLSAGHVATGGDHSCSIGDDGNAYCWGIGANGRLGTGNTANQTTPSLVQKPLGVSSFTMLALGSKHSCGIADTGDAYCWGAGADGRLGDGGISDRTTPSLVAKPGGVSSFIYITAGDRHSCAIGNNGNSYCWGTGANGRLGTGNTTNQTTPAMVTLPAGVTFVSISAGETHSCAIGDNRNAYCWGSGDNGRLGNGSLAEQTEPVLVQNTDGMVGFRMVSAGKSHSCAMGINDKAYCWGLGGSGQLGNGVTAQRYTPIEVIGPDGLRGFVSLSAGDEHTCAIGSDGWLYCWGTGVSGRLGDGTVTQHNVAVAIDEAPGLFEFSAIDVSFGNGSSEGHSCATSANGLSACWGAGTGGKLGNGSSVQQNIPVLVDDTLLNAKQCTL